MMLNFLKLLNFFLQCSSKTYSTFFFAALQGDFHVKLIQGT